ncbi:MAG TPA: VOC family protein [Vicinamibacterales bacterium]|nr:VOC family protein [Vicinamibacterales bacterium]
MRPGRLLAASLTLLVITYAVPASAQLLAAKDGPIVYGHHHLAASDIPAQMKFFADTLGGTAITFGPQNLDVVKFPNVFIFFRQQNPTGGSKGTTVNHIGFSVPNLRQTIDKVKANGYAVITRTEVAATQPVVDDIAAVNANVSIAFVMGPDDVKVELVENKQQAMPIMLHHVHFFGPQNTEMQAWYVKVFGAKPRNGGNFPAADLPGVALNFSPSPDPVIGTTGRAIEHLGFEVKDLEGFCKKLEAMGITLNVPYRKVEALGLAIAFITDPWGTSIELNEGLDKLQ